MFRRLRETGPAGLVPLAWIFVTAAHLEAVTMYTLFVAHVVMSVLLLGFAVTARRDMQAGVLRVWWYIIAGGFLAAAAGTAGFLVERGSTPLFVVALYGWMLLPAFGLIETGRRVPMAGAVYLGAGTLSVVGAVIYTAAPFVAQPTYAVVVGLTTVGLGQTIGILDAVYRY